MQVTQGFKYELLFERGPMVAFLQYVYTSATCWDQSTMGYPYGHSVEDF